MKFSVGIVGYGKNPHAMCFWDVAKALASSLRELGHEVVPTFDPSPGRLIMFGANNFIDTGAMPKDAIVFNSEQLAAVGDARYLMQNYDQYKKHVIWEYAQSNSKRLTELGMERVVMCPIGYHPSMSKRHIYGYTGKQDIDVLFYGSTNARRVKVLDELEAAGLKVVRPDKSFEGWSKFFGIYGEDLDHVIARSKVVLNMHYYDHSRAVFEIFRTSYLFANKKCVVSEVGNDDALDAFANRACAVVGYSGLVEQCKHLVENLSARKNYEQQGFEEFKKIDFVESVRRAVEAS